MKIEEGSGVSVPVPTLGPNFGAGYVDGAAQHRASTVPHDGACSIWFSSHLVSKRIEGRHGVHIDPDASGSHRSFQQSRSHISSERGYRSR